MAGAGVSTGAVDSGDEIGGGVEAAGGGAFPVDGWVVVESIVSSGMGAGAGVPLVVEIVVSGRRLGGRRLDGRSRVRGRL